MLLLAKNRLNFCSLLAKIELVFVCYKNQLGFCDNHKNRFGFCSSLAKMDLIFVSCKNRLGFITCIKTKSVHWWIDLVFVARKILTRSFYIIRKICCCFFIYTTVHIFIDISVFYRSVTYQRAAVAANERIGKWSCMDVNKQLRLSYHVFSCS